MSAAIFDTHALVKTLQTKGFQAENANIRAEITPLKWAIGVCVAGIIPLVFKAFF
jgi:hypothetical protein